MFGAGPSTHRAMNRDEREHEARIRQIELQNELIEAQIEALKKPVPATDVREIIAKTIRDMMMAGFAPGPHRDNSIAEDAATIWGEQYADAIVAALGDRLVGGSK